MKFHFPALARLEHLAGQIDDPLASELQEVVKTLGARILEVREEAERLARAQADALVNSAMMMTELQTARAEVETAHARTREANLALTGALKTAQTNERRFRLLSETAPVGIFQMDRTGRCVHMNAGLLLILGASSAEQAGDWRLFLKAADRAKVLEQWESAAAESREFTGEFRIVTPDGASRWVLVHAQPLHLGGEEPDGYIGTMTDITAHKEAERLKDELVSTVSHELRTPLTSLRGFAELMLKRSFTPEKQREFLSIIHQEATRLTNLINDFLDLQRLQSGRQTYHLTEVALEPLLRETLAVFTPANERHVLLLDVDPLTPLVRADADCLRQVMSKFLSNAIKFSPQGGMIRVRVRVARAEVLVAVADQGVGIPPEALSQLFSKFFRVDNADTRSIGGTGLGLALVKEIIESHGGRVWVESTVGQGSTFFFTLPVAKDTVQSEAALQL